MPTELDSAIPLKILEDFERLVEIPLSKVVPSSHVDHPANPFSSANRPFGPPPPTQRNPAIISSKADYLANLIDSERNKFHQEVAFLKTRVKDVEAQREASDQELTACRQNLQALAEAKETQRTKMAEHWLQERRNVRELETVVANLQSAGRNEVERALDGARKEHEAEVAMMRARAEKARQEAVVNLQTLSSQLEAAVGAAGRAHAQAMHDLREEHNRRMMEAAANFQREWDRSSTETQKLQKERDELAQAREKAGEDNAEMTEEIVRLKALVAQMKGEAAEKTHLETRAQNVQAELDLVRRDLESSLCSGGLKDERLKEAEEGKVTLTAEVARLKAVVAGLTGSVERESSLRTHLEGQNQLLSGKLERRDILLADLRSSLASVGVGLAHVSGMEMKNRSFSPNDDRPTLDEHSGTTLAYYAILQETTNVDMDGPSPVSVPIFSMEELDKALRSRPTVAERTPEVPQGPFTPIRSATPLLPAPAVQPHLASVSTSPPTAKPKDSDIKAKNARLEVVITTIPSTPNGPKDLAVHKPPSLTSLRYTPSPQPPRSIPAQEPRLSKKLKTRHSEAAPSVAPSSASSASLPAATVSISAAVGKKLAVKKPIAAQPPLQKRTRKPTAKIGRKSTTTRSGRLDSHL